MCTITILEEDEKIIVTMNRDEAISRQVEMPPRRYENNLIYPKDSGANGTWFAISEVDGKVACLMNRYDIPRDEEKISRGEIPIKILEGVKPEDLKLDNYNPFSLIIISDNIKKYDFDGSELSLEEFDFSEEWFFTSSSYKWNDVLEYRRERFDKWLNNKDYRIGIPKIHLDQSRGKEEYSCLMKRENSITKSIIQAVVDKEKGRVEINYYYDPNNCFKKHNFGYELIS